MEFSAFDFFDIQDFIDEVGKEMKKRKNNYDDESLSHIDGRNTHNNNDFEL